MTPRFPSWGPFLVWTGNDTDGLGRSDQDFLLNPGVRQINIYHDVRIMPAFGHKPVNWLPFGFWFSISVDRLNKIGWLKLERFGRDRHKFW